MDANDGRGQGAAYSRKLNLLGGAGRPSQFFFLQADNRVRHRPVVRRRGADRQFSLRYLWEVTRGGVPCPRRGRRPPSGAICGAL